MLKELLLQIFLWTLIVIAGGAIRGKFYGWKNKNIIRIVLTTVIIGYIILVLKYFMKYK